MSIRHGLQTFGALGLAKDWNEEDHPRDDDGKFSSTGGGSDDDEDEEYGPGEGFHPEDQERHDEARAKRDKHSSRLYDNLNELTAIFHDKNSTADQIVVAGREIRGNYKKAWDAQEEMNEIRTKYGDEHDIVKRLDDVADLVDGLEGHESFLKQVRSESASYAQFSMQLAAHRAASAPATLPRHDDPITELERELDAASSSMAARRAALRSKPA